MIKFPPYQTTATVVMFIASIMTGIVAMTIFIAARLPSFKSLLVSLNFSASWPSLTKDLTSRTFVNASCTPEFRRSIFFCIASNRGNAIFNIMKIAKSSNGIITSSISTSCRFIRKAIIRPPTSIPGARNIRRRLIMITF